jgi:branched-subunit amino acid aminotransferase/4-amino-4-deoxychorismate lyase
MERLMRGAEILRINVDPVQVEQTLNAARAAIPTEVEIQVESDGKVNVSARQLRVVPAAWRIAWSDTPNDPNDPWRALMTTLSEPKNIVRNMPNHVDEMLMTNSDGQVLNGTRTNIFVEVDGAMLTPAQSDGARPGVFRQALLDAGDVTEASLKRKDIVQANNIFLGNSVIEMIPTVWA